MGMKTVLHWKQGMAFEAEAGQHKVQMDAKAPLGQDGGPTPKELVLVGLGGCTAMDVAALLKKNKQQPSSFDVSVEAQTSSGGHPIVFTEALITYTIQGPVESAILLESVQKSQNIFCGVSAMLGKAFPIRYRVELNGQIIGEGAHGS